MGLKTGRTRRGVAILTAVAAAVGTLTGINLITGAPAAKALGDYRAGEVDPSWVTGNVFQDQTLGAGTESPQAIAVDSHDRPVIAVNQGTTGQINLVRLTSNGRYDTTFNGDGRTTANIASVLGGGFVSGGVRDIVVDSQDRTYVLYQAGYGASGSQFAVTRFQSDGGLDSTWGVNGTTVANFAGEEQNFGLALAVDNARHTLWVAGSDRDINASFDRARVFRWDTNNWNVLPVGTAYPASIQQSVFTSVAVDPATGDVVAGGYIDDPSVVAANDTGDAMLARFDAANANYDSSFAPSHPFGAYARAIINEGESVRDIAIDPVSHDIGIAVRDFTGISYNAAARLTSNGESTGSQWNGGNPFQQFSWLWPEAVAFSPAPGQGDLLVAGGYFQGVPSTDTTDTSAVAKLGDDGLTDTTWGGQIQPGYAFLNKGSTNSLRTSLALDSGNRPLITSGNGNDTRIARFLPTRATPDVLSATKILFEEGGNMFGLAGGRTNAPVVDLGQAPFARQNLMPVANEGGKLFYTQTGGAHSVLYRAAAANGSNPRPFLSNPYFNNYDVKRPTAAFGYVHFLVAQPGQGFCHEFAFEDTGDTAGSTSCNLTDAAANPGVQERVAYVRNGSVFLNETSGYREVEVAHNVGATRVEWGYDGTVLLFDSTNGATTTLNKMVWHNGFEMSYYYQYPIPDPQTLVTVPGASSISSFVMAPDSGATYSIAYSVGNEIRSMKDDGTAGPLVYAGSNPHLGVWVRNLSVFPVGGAQTALQPSEIEAKNVPLQSKSPAAQEATGGGDVKKAGLLKLNLFKSPILKLNLFKSPLLKLNLFKSPLLKLNLFKSSFGLANLGITDDLGGSVLVQQGLQQIKLNTLQIVSGPSWRERFTAPGMSEESVRLASVPLQDVSLAQVLALSPQIDFPSLEQLDLSQSPLGTVSVMPFLLGNTRLSQIGGIDWCGVFAARGAADCGAAYGVPGSALKGLSASLLSLQIAGFRLDDLPATNGHLNDLRTITYDQVNWDLNTSILPNIRLDRTNEGGIDLHEASVGGALVKDITPDANAVVDCSRMDCAAEDLTVYAASIANPTALRAESTVAQLGRALTGFPLNELALGLWGDPGDDPYDQPPSALGITPQNAGTSTTPFIVSYARTAVGTGQTVNPSVTVQLPFGFTYKPNSSSFGDSSFLTPGGGEIYEHPLADPVIVGNTLRWDTVPVNLFDENYMQLHFFATPTAPVEDQAKVQLDDGATIQDVGSELLQTFDRFETGPVVEDAPYLRKDTLYFSRLDSSTDVDYFNIPISDCCYGEGEDAQDFSIQPGSTLTVYLSQLRYDADLVVYHPPESQTGVPLRPEGNAAAIDNIADQPVANAGEPLLTDDGTSDVPVLPGYKVAGLSNNRGNRAEKVATITWPDIQTGEGPEGNYVLQVSGFNGAHGAETYAIRFTVTPPASVPDAPARSATFAGPGSAPVAPLGAADPAPSTLILTNPTRLTALYGASGAAQVAASLNAYATTVPATTPATIRTVLPVDSDPNVRAAYALWDARPNDPDRANDVVRAINEFVDTYLGVGSDADKRPQLKSIVIAGSDEVIPMARVQDLTQIANERTFAQELRETAAGTGGNNAVYGAALAGKILTDDGYGAFNPRAFGGEWLYVPDVALGRLVETPDQIAATVNEYVTPAPGRALGEVRPTKTLSAGHDFMTGLANDIQDAFEASLPSATHDSLIGENWNRSALEGKLAPAAPDVIAINVHYSPWALGPASQLDPNHADEPDLSAAQATSAADLRRRLLFTMGCHSGFNITNYFYGDANHADWPEAVAGEPVSAYIGQTGFGLGVANDYLAFSQKLMFDFSKFITATSFGQALQQAKQEYLANGVTNPYDYKVLAEATYYGIPDYRLAGATSLVPEPNNVPTDDFGDDNGVPTGIYHSSLTIENPTSGNSGWVKHDTAEGSFYSLPGNEQAVVQDRPVQPKVVDDVTTDRANENVSGLLAASAFINSLEIGDVDEGFNPVLAKPQVADASSTLAESQPDELVFPNKFADVSQFTDIAGKLRQRLSVVPALFRSTGKNGNGQLIGDETRFSKIGIDVLYRTADYYDNTAPVLTNGRAIKNGDDVDLSVNASDFESGVSRVVALVRRDGSNKFELYEMYRGEDGEFFDPTAYFARLENVNGPIDIIFEAVSSASLVGLLTNKGQFTQATAPDVINYSFNEDATSAPNATITEFNKPVNVHFSEEGPEERAPLNLEVLKGGVAYGGPTFPDNDVALTELGDYTINYSSAVGDARGSLHIRINPTPAPDNDVAVSYSKPMQSGVFQGGPVTVFLAPSPGRTLKYGVDAAPTADYTDAGITLPNAGTYEVRFQTDLDAAAAPPVVRTVTVKIVDPQAHQVVPELTGPKVGDTYTGPVQVHLKELPQENAIQVSVDGGPAVTYPNNTFTVSTEGHHTISYTTAGTPPLTGTVEFDIHVEATPETVHVEYSTPPVGEFFTSPFTATVVSSDPASVVSVKVDGLTVANPVKFGDPAFPFQASDGTYSITWTTSRGSSGSQQVKLDTKAPGISIVKPLNGQKYLLNEPLTASFFCSDVFLLGAGGCEGTQANGSVIDTSTVSNGTPRSFTVVGKDQTGREATKTATYEVTFRSTGVCGGAAGHAALGDVVNGGAGAGLLQTIRVLFRVCDYNGTPVTSFNPSYGMPKQLDANGAVVRDAQGGCAPLLGLLPICLFQQRQTFFKPSGTGWYFDHDTSNLLIGNTYVFRIDLDDGSKIYYTVTKKLLPLL